MLMPMPMPMPMPLPMPMPMPRPMSMHTPTNRTIRSLYLRPSFHFIAIGMLNSILPLKYGSEADNQAFVLLVLCFLFEAEHQAKESSHAIRRGAESETRATDGLDQQPRSETHNRKPIIIIIIIIIIQKNAEHVRFTQ